MSQWLYTMQTDWTILFEIYQQHICHIGAYLTSYKLTRLLERGSTKTFGGAKGHSIETANSICKVSSLILKNY